MKKMYIQPSADFEEIEGLNDLMEQKSVLRAVGFTAAEGYDVAQPTGDVKDVKYDTPEEEWGLN